LKRQPLTDGIGGKPRECLGFGGGREERFEHTGPKGKPTWAGRRDATGCAEPKISRIAEIARQNLWRVCKAQPRKRMATWVSATYPDFQATSF